MQEGRGFCDLASGGEVEVGEGGADALEEEAEEDGPLTTLRTSSLALLPSSTKSVTAAVAGNGRLAAWWHGGDVQRSGGAVVMFLQ